MERRYFNFILFFYFILFLINFNLNNSKEINKRNKKEQNQLKIALFTLVTGHQSGYR